LNSPADESLRLLVRELCDALGKARVITEPDALEKYRVEERSLYRGASRVVVVPTTVEDVATAVRLCAARGVAVVAQGGNTGLVGGAVAGAGEVVLSLEKLNRIRELDPVNYTVTVEAGCVLASLQDAAAQAGCLFPLSLGAEGSCTIGGNVASNAGGVNVLKYGNTRDLVLGLEVVLADGRIWNGLRALHKDNSGYSTKNLFIGSEGTLGIVTAATLKLFPKPEQSATAFCALASPDAALKLLSLARRRSGDHVSAFELISDFALGIVCRHSGGENPLDGEHPWYALIELTTPRPGSDLGETLEGFLAEAFEADMIVDAVVASSVEQATRLWQLRERIPEAQKRAGGSIKHDISVPVSRVPAFIAEASAAVAARLPGVHVCAFGHVGDGNVHYNLTQPDGMDKQAFLDLWGDMNDIVHAIAAGMGGSISAEHGIGLLKVEEIAHFRTDVETDLMRAIKRAFDPQGLMNPGKMIVGAHRAKEEATGAG